jgi:phthiodiolone/phenolphthiodiolone dimycocerosates ketoreductase
METRSSGLPVMDRPGSSTPVEREQSGTHGQPTRRGLAVGMLVGARPPIGGSIGMLRLARMAGVAFCMLYDHVQAQFPSSIWDRRLAYWIEPGSSPHEDFEVFTALGRLSGMAGGLQLGVGVTDVLRRHPIELAHAALTLSHLTGRPFILGIGAGERMGTAPYGLDPVPRADRLEEAARYIRTALDTRAPFDLEGRYFNADRALLGLRVPPGGRPRVWMAAHGPRSMAACGRVGDGWFPLLALVPDYERGLATVRAAAVAAGRDPGEITAAGHHDLLVAPTEREARALLDSRIARWAGVFGSTGAEWRALGVENPLGDEFGGYRDMLVEALDPVAVEEAIRTVPAELVERRFLWGTPAQVMRQLGDLVDAGLQSVSLMPISLHDRRLALHTVWTIRGIVRRFR